MKTHVYHGGDVWEERDSTPSRVSHILSGPHASVVALALRMEDTWPTMRVLSSREKAQHLELVLARPTTDGGTAVAVKARVEPDAMLTA